MKHKIFYLIMLIILVSITNKVSAQFVPYQSGHFKRLAADTLYNLTGCDAPTTTPNSYRRVVWYYDSCNQINYYWQPENQVWATITGGGGGSGGGISEVIATNGLSNVNDSTIKWGGFLTENTHIRGDNFSLTIDSLKSFIVSSYPANRAFFGFDTANVIITGKGVNAPSASLQLLPNNPLTYGSSSLGTARLIGTTGADAQILEVNGSAISFGHSGAAQPAKLFLKYSDSLDVASPTKIAVWDSDTLKSADVSAISGGVRDTAALVQGYGIYINNADSTYKPNGFDVLIAVDTSRIATKTEINIITNSDTAVFIVDSIANAPTGSEPPNTKYLVGTSPTGVFASHANDVAELIGAVWTFTDPVAQQQLIVDNDATYATYQYNGATWIPTSILVRHNYNRGIGSLRMGTFDKNTVTISAWNKPSIVIDTTRDVALPKFINTPSRNYLNIDSATGKIDTNFFRPLIAGTGISIDPGPVGDTISSTGGGGSANTTWIYFVDHGGIADSSTDNSAALTAAIAALPAKGGVIIFDAGVYKFNSSVTVNKAVTFLGAGGGMYLNSTSNTSAVTKLITNSGSINLFNVTADNVVFQKICLENSATTPTAGSGIRVSNGTGFKLYESTVGYFYTNVDIVTGWHWSIQNSVIVSPVSYGIKIRDSVYPDRGDAVIDGCLFYPVGRTGSAAIYQESGGGLKVNNSKFNCGGTTICTGQWFYAYHGNFNAGTTGDLQFSNCSFENYLNKAIYLPNPSAHFVGNMTITGCQFSALVGSAITDVDISTINNVSIVGNVFRATNAASTAVALNTIGKPAVSNSYYNYTTPSVFTSCTNTLMDYNSAADSTKVVIGFTATGQPKQITNSTLGYVLTSNGSSEPSFQPAPGAGTGLSGSGAAQQVAVWNGSTALSGFTTYKFDTTNTFLGVGTTTPAARLHLSGNITSPAWTTAGINLRTDAATYTDNSSSGTVPLMAINSFRTPTIAASSSVTYTNAATVYIEGVPVNGTNVVASGGRYALYVAGPSLYTAAVTVNGSLSVAGATNLSGALNAGSTSTLSGNVLFTQASALAAGNTLFATYRNTINQSGTAGYKVHYIDIFQQALGSGVHYLADWGTNSAANSGGTHTSKFIVDNEGTLTLSGGFAAAYVAKTSTYTATSADHTIDCTSGTFTVTLPTAASIAGKEFTIVNSGSGTITIGTTSSQTFNNITSTPTTLTLSPVGSGAIVSYTLKSTGANWIVTGKVKNE